jgi:hypothetical protein
VLCTACLAEPARPALFELRRELFAFAFALLAPLRDLALEPLLEAGLDLDLDFEGLRDFDLVVDLPDDRFDEVRDLV